MGQFADGQRTGQGTISWVNGNIYTGSFKEGRQEGPGTFRWKNGDSLQGTFVSDLAEGNGQLLTANGEKYVGELHKNQKHGRGTIFAADGSRKASGIWENGFLIKPDQQPTTQNVSSTPNPPPITAPQATSIAPLPIIPPPTQPTTTLDTPSYLQSWQQIQTTLSALGKSLFESRFESIGAPLISLLVAVVGMLMLAVKKLFNAPQGSSLPSRTDGPSLTEEDSSYASQWPNILKVPVDCSSDDLDDAYWLALKNLYPYAVGRLALIF
jgi:hypothetical protein